MKILLNRENYILLLGSSNYKDTIVFDRNGKLYINPEKIPANGYIPVDNNYTLGYLLTKLVKKCNTFSLIPVDIDDTRNLVCVNNDDSYNEVKKIFESLREKAIRFGLGDIRLTIDQQKEILEIIRKNS